MSAVTVFSAGGCGEENYPRCHICPNKSEKMLIKPKIQQGEARASPRLAYECRTAASSLCLQDRDTSPWEDYITAMEQE